MLPIFRIVAVGGVFLAILIFVLALTPPDGARAPLPQRIFAARGPLIDRGEHPEWRQFLIHAALLRASELDRLRELPSAPTRVTPEPAVQAAPPPEAANEKTALAPVELSAGDNAQPEELEPQAALSEPVQPSTPKPPDPVPSQAAIAEPPAPPHAAIVPSPASTSAAVTPIAVDDVPKPPADMTAQDSTDATETRVALTPDVPVVLPQRRPTAADEPRLTARVKRDRRTRARKVKVEPPVRTPTFLDLLFAPAATQNSQTPPLGPQPQPKAPHPPRSTTTSSLAPPRDFGVTSD